MGESTEPNEPKTDRWRRRVDAGEAPVSESLESLRLSAKEQARLAERASRAASLGGSENQQRVSVRRTEANPNLQQLTVDSAKDADSDRLPTIDLKDLRKAALDLRASLTDDADSSADALSAAAPSSSSSSGTAIASGTPTPPAPASPGKGSAAPTGSRASNGSGSPKRGLPDPPVAPAPIPRSTQPGARVARADRSADAGPGVAKAPAGTSKPPVTLGRAEVVAVPPAATQLPVAVEREERPRRRGGAILLVVAASLAVLCGVLGAFWMRERSTIDELRTELARAEATDEIANQGIDGLNDDVRTLELENQRLQQQINDMSALVLELPEGRVTEIDVPFTPTFADETNGRLIVMSDDGDYITFAEGADGPITDSGRVSGSPTGLFAATRKAWIATDAGQVDVLSLVAGELGLPSTEVGQTAFLAPEERGYWTYSVETGEVVRRKKGDSTITNSVSVPVGVVDLTIGAGSVWALGDDGRVYRINTADLTVSPLEAGDDLISVTASPDALWTLSAADGSLRRIDPVSGEVLVTVPVGRDPIDAEYAGGSVWVALRAGSSLIEVDTRTAAVISRTAIPGEPTALHRGDSGAFVTTSDPDVPLLRVASLIPAEPDPEVTPEDDESSVDG